ncbi:MAG: HPF/RaiA family ribosome-associated protein [Candidatus Thiodiazotropha sp.]
MQIDIQARNFPLTEALRRHVERRLEFALSTRDDHIQRVLVRLYDINGPRGGADKCCQIMVMLAHLPDVVIEDTEVDLYTAIDRAADRASRTVGRRLARQRDRGRFLGLRHMALIPERPTTH